MSDQIVARIRRLIAQASSGNENEARNAAYMACKLIREHKVELYPAGAVRQDPASAIGTETYRQATKEFNNIVDTFRNVVGNVGGAAKEVKKAQKTVNEIFRDGKEVRMPNPKDDPVHVKTKFDGKCKACGKSYKAGDHVWFRAGIGCTHSGCGATALI